MKAAPYQNSGNDLVLSLIPESVRRVLDVGCGAGDNARRLKERSSEILVTGVTYNATEAEMAAPFMSQLHVKDIERDDLSDIRGPFDLVLFSHVLEHLRDPVVVVRRFLPLLAPEGYVVIAVPNTLEWRTRLAFLRGRFQYTDHGVLDRTHLRFFTYHTAVKELLVPISELNLVNMKGRGAAPLGPLRRHLLPNKVRVQIDNLMVRTLPNLFAGEVAMVARRRGQANSP